MSLFYSAGLGGSAIPDAAIHQWLFKEGSADTVADEIGSADGTLDSGISWVSGTWREGYALQGDGSSQVTLTTLDDFAAVLDSGFAVALTYQSTNNGQLFGAQGSTYTAGLTTEAAFGESGGAINWRQGDGSDTIRVYTDNAYTDGSKYRVVLNQTSNTASDIEFWVNGSEVSTTVDISGAMDGIGTFDTAFSFFNINGNANTPLDGTLDAPLLTDAPLTQSEIQSDYDRQPWS